MMKAMILALATTAMTALAVPAAAQTAPAPAPAPAPQAAADTGSLPDIVVTARRREEKLQDVPLAVTAFSPKILAEDRVTTRTDLANFTPSLMTITGGFPSEFAEFSLRGQGPAFGAVPGVVTYFAEVPELNGIDGRVGTYFDLANVQVLAGPQGTLFGKNATGGNVLFEPARPTNRQEGYVQFELGNLRDVRTEFAVNMPIVDDKVLLRVAGEIGRRDGYTKDVGPYFTGKDYDNLDYQSIRASLIVKPTDNFELYTVGRYYHSDTNGPGTVLQQYNPALGAQAFYPGLATAVATQQALGPRQVSYDLDEFSKTDYWQVLNQAKLTLGDHLTIKNVLSYSELVYRYAYDYDATPYPVAGQTSATGNPTQDPTYLSEELQLQGKVLHDAVNFSLGGFIDNLGLKHDQGGLFTQFPTSLLVGPVPVVINTTARSHAFFGQGTIDLGKAGLVQGLSFTGGLRHTWDETATYTQIYVLPSTSGSGHFQYTSYDASLDYQITQGIHTYITSRDAYKAGGVNGPIPADSPFHTFPPEKLQDLEIGLKAQARLAGMPTRFNIDAYRGNYSNIQRTAPAVVDGTVLNVTESAAKARIQGVELNTAIEPFRGLSLTASYSYIDARYTEVTNAEAGAILQGSAFPYVPKNKLALGADFRQPAGHLGTLEFSASWAYQSKFSTAENNLAQVPYLPGYNTLSLRAGINNIAGNNLDLTFFMANATNNTYATGLQDLYNAGLGTVTYTYDEPRTYGVQLRFHW